MDARYEAMANPPQDALKPIGFGNLKGKSDINPQWRYEALTEQFGLCGVGWKFEITDIQQVPVPASSELMVFVSVKLYVKDGDAWSAPIPGYGGDFLIKKDKNGLHGNDEAIKMATTDALGTAAKMVGVAASIYRGKGSNGGFDTKYGRMEDAQANSQGNAYNNTPKGTNKPTEAPTAPQKPSRNQLLGMVARDYAAKGFTSEQIGQVVKFKFGKDKGTELTQEQAQSLYDNFEKFAQEMYEQSMAG